jgi:hypothetical protein
MVRRSRWLNLRIFLCRQPRARCRAEDPARLYPHVRDFAAFFGRSPETASFEDVRRFQLRLAANGAFGVTLKRYDIVEHTTFIHEPRKLPVVLSPEEVARDAAPGSTISRRFC